VASRATVGFSSLTLLHIFSVSVTCRLCALIILVVLSYVLRDRHFETINAVVCSGHTHYKLNHYQFQLSCIAVLLIYLYMRGSQIDSDGLFYAVVLTRQTSDVDLTYGLPQTPIFAECRTTRVYKRWLWSWLHLLWLQNDDQVHCELYLMLISASWEN
jgi:hypothetical protein